MTVTTKPQQRLRRRKRVRSKISGTAERPRLSVFRSNRGVFAQLIERDDAFEFANQLYIDDEPSGRILLGVRIVVVALGIEGAAVRISFARNADDSRDTRHIAARIVKKCQIALFYRVAQHVARSGRRSAHVLARA